MHGDQGAVVIVIVSREWKWEWTISSDSMHVEEVLPLLDDPVRLNFAFKKFFTMTVFELARP